MYIVKQRSAARPGEQEIMRLLKEPDAVQFIQEKIQQDLLYKMNNIYTLYEGDDFLREFTQDSVIAIQSTSSEEDTGSQASGKSSTQSFRPTPFNTAPRIGPQSYIRDEENEDKEK